MKHESAVQAVKELMRKDSVFRSVIQGWGVATLLIGLFMFYMGANTYIQSYKQTDWVFGSAYITDISELNRSKVGRGGINYSMTYEYEVDGTHYTGKYGPLANSIEVGKSIRIKYDPNAPENSTGVLAPSSSDLVFAIGGLILAVVGFFISGVFGLIRRLIGKDRSDEKEAKDSMSAEDAAYERKVRIGNTLRALFPILAFVLFGVLIMLLQGGRF